MEFEFKMKSDKATNGREGIEKVIERQNKSVTCTCNQNNHNYKIIFMDCNMPIMDGFEATEAIRKIKDIEQSELKIVALTANTNEGFKVQCHQSGMDHFLTKPVSVLTLRQVL